MKKKKKLSTKQKNQIIKKIVKIRNKKQIKNIRRRGINIRRILEDMKENVQNEMITKNKEGKNNDII